ncbi:MAG: hypothetical protein HRT51_11865 [Colwellia sp.]|nr:hypothetical protein [Colwellia sp.]
MKKVKLSKSLMSILSTTSCYLTKMEILLIFVLFITSCYAVKMEMLIADNKPLNSPLLWTKNVVKERDSDNIKQSIALVEVADQNYKNDTNTAEIKLVYFMPIAQMNESKLIGQGNHQQLLAL